MLLTDLHIHSTFSDGKLSIPEIIDFYGQRGFGAIAITDHLCENTTVIGKAARYLNSTLTEANFPLYLEILKSETERAWRLYKMVVIPGFELTKNTVLNHRSAHIVALGVTKFISANGDVAELAKNIREAGGFSIAAHPVHTQRFEKQTYHLWDRRQELLPVMDAWEVASGPHIFPEVLRSGLPMIATSDFHKPSHINAYKTLIDSERHPEAILAAIRAQKVSFQIYQENVANDLCNYSAHTCLDNIVISDDIRDLINAAEIAETIKTAG